MQRGPTILFFHLCQRWRNVGRHWFTLGLFFIHYSVPSLSVQCSSSGRGCLYCTHVLWLTDWLSDYTRHRQDDERQPCSQINGAFVEFRASVPGLGNWSDRCAIHLLDWIPRAAASTAESSPSGTGNLTTKAVKEPNLITVGNVRARGDSDLAANKNFSRNTESQSCIISGVTGMTCDMNLFKKKLKINNALFDRLFTDLRFGGSFGGGGTNIPLDISKHRLSQPRSCAVWNCRVVYCERPSNWKDPHHKNRSPSSLIQSVKKKKKIVSVVVLDGRSAAVQIDTKRHWSARVNTISKPSPLTCYAFPFFFFFSTVEGYAQDSLRRIHKSRPEKPSDLTRTPLGVLF